MAVGDRFTPQSRQPSATPIDAAIDAEVAAGASLAGHEGQWPTQRELRQWYWSSCYRDRAAAVRAWWARMVSFGATAVDADTYARRWADEHGYGAQPRPKGDQRGPSIIDTVKAQVPIEVVARRLTELREGRNALTGRCPFHDDRSPSFVLWPERGIWRCYGACAEGGDVVKLWQRAREKGLVR